MPDKNISHSEQLNKELLDDLDQYLVLSTAKSELKVSARKNKELDKLIQADLVAASLAKKTVNDFSKSGDFEKPSLNIAQPLPETLPEIKENIEDIKEKADFLHQPSTYILDLRSLKKTPPRKIQIYRQRWLENWFRFKKNLALKFPAPVRSPKLAKPARLTRARLARPAFLVKLDIRYLTRDAVVFALITTLVLLPIRGLVFFGQFSKDRDFIIGHGQAGLFKFQTGVLSAAGNAYDVAQADFSQALLDFSQARDSLNAYNEWLLKASSLVPVLGQSLSLSKNILSASANISEAAASINQKLQSGAKPTEYLAFISKQLEGTIPYLEGAGEDLNDLPLTLLPLDWQEPLATLREHLPALLADLQAARELFPVLADFLGQDGEKRYLVLFQNNNELRASGG